MPSPQEVLELFGVVEELVAHEAIHKEMPTMEMAFTKEDFGKCFFIIVELNVKRKTDCDCQSVHTKIQNIFRSSDKKTYSGLWKANPSFLQFCYLQMPARKQEPATSSFESEFERMTTIVDKLERGNVPLGEMLALYEEAMTLSAKLKEVLTEAELRVEKLAAVHEELSSPKMEANDILDNEDLF